MNDLQTIETVAAQGITDDLVSLKATWDKAVETCSQMEMELSVVAEQMLRASELGNFDRLARLTQRRQELQAKLPPTQIESMRAASAFHTSVVAAKGAEAATVSAAVEKLAAKIAEEKVELEKLELMHFNLLSERRESKTALSHLDQQLKQFAASQNSATGKKD